MQITLPGIDNYTLYYETFVFILRVYAIMLFDYVYRCTQSSARTICTLENNYKPANERHAKHRKEKIGKEDDIRVRAYIHPYVHIRTHIRMYAHTYRHTTCSHTYLSKYRAATLLRQGKTIFVRSPRPNRIKSSFASLASSKNSKLLILICAKRKENNQNEARRLHRDVTSI